MITINNVLTPLIDQFLKLNQGITVCTPRYPNDRKLLVKLVTLVGDIVATHKVAGFMSHSATKLCSWCEIKASERQELQAGRLRNGQNVLAVSSRWKTLESKASQKKLAQKTGIRWSELNWLPYWDPVLNVSLGVMHNWFEGILQHHFRYRWGCELNEAKKVVNYEDVSSDEGNTMDVDDCDGSLNSESDGFDGFLPEPSKKKILAQIQEVVVPKGITRIPVQLGAAKAGKLKASEWHALFGIYLPLASMDILWSSKAELTNDNSKLLINLCSLIQCTNILSRKSFTKADCIKFSQTYELYQKTSMDLFKELWGPPMGISEFGGESLIGALQGYKTNFLIGKMEQTMMKKFNQLQRLEQKTQLLTKVSRNGAGYKFEMKEETYNTVLQYLRRHKPNLRDYRDLPHPTNALILQNYSKSYRSIEWKLGLKISTLPPNNFIEYKDSNAKHFGKICYILDLVSKEIHSGPLLVVQCFEPVGGHKCGMLNSLLEEISVWHVKESHRLEIVPMEKIGSLAAVHTLPAWSLGISSVSLLIKPITNILDFTINL
ncbi:hypothetical protein O181_094124 [Austropuccinia psidii MF-1]|uniref:Uncharacterized protein n=1 Tax=Austropuccinia psidii MF-1 TaxID=1389203 RepID=A0A9Q3J2T2_9BASI|nr:hypothetical protein [Austropuccinia psidii MF-1]